jgi:hypothetical protein
MAKAKAMRTSTATIDILDFGVGVGCPSTSSPSSTCPSLPNPGTPGKWYVLLESLMVPTPAFPLPSGHRTPIRRLTNEHRVVVFDPSRE